MSEPSINMATECPICVQNINKTTRASVKCPDPECGFECCRACMKEYIVTQRHDPKCMKCSKAFTRMYLNTVLPTTWIRGEFKQERENILFEREKSMIPDTMPHVENEVTCRKMNAEVREIQNQLVELRREMEARLSVIARIRGGECVSKSTKKFLIKCPSCPAFVDKKGKCSSCGTRVCIHCKDVLVANDGINIDDIIVQKPIKKGDDDDADQEGADQEGANQEGADHDEQHVADGTQQIHICNAETLASAMMIETDTKPCPKCGNRIHKIEGCDQMFDPHCGTAFSWRTGQIVTGIIHNPHYFQWQQQQNGNVARTPGDIICGGPPDTREILQALVWVPRKEAWHRYRETHKDLVWPGTRSVDSKKNRMHIEDINSRLYLINACRILSHIQHVSLPVLQTGWDQRTNQAERVKYIMNELSAEDFKKLLAQKERIIERDREIQQVYDTFLNAGADILRRFMIYYVSTGNTEVGYSKDYIKKTITVHEMMGGEERGVRTEWWWTSYNHTIAVRGRSMNPGHVRVPVKEKVTEVYEELRRLEEYCNEQFAAISKSWKLSTPMLSIQGDHVSTKTWYKE